MFPPSYQPVNQTSQGFEEDTGLPLDPVPSSRQGWGAMHLSQALRLGTNANSWNLSVVDGAPLRSTGQRDAYCVRATGGVVRVTLVWWDPPASPTAAKALVNDLDLTVRTEDGLVLKVCCNECAHCWKHVDAYT